MSEIVDEKKNDVPPVDAANGGESGNVQLPESHPLVTTLAAQKEQIRELKERAKRADELEQAQMSEQEKVDARLQAAEQRATELELRNQVAEVALQHRLSPEDATLLNGISDVETMQQLAERLAAAKPNEKHFVPSEGTGTPPTKDERTEFANFLVGRGS